MYFFKEQLETTGTVSQISFVFVILLWVILLGKLFSVQVIQRDKYQANAQSNYIEELSKTPPRGVIFDRNGLLLARNTTSVDIVLDLSDLFVPAASLSEQEKLDVIQNAYEAISYRIKLDALTQSSAERDTSEQTQKLLDEIVSGSADADQKLYEIAQTFGGSAKFVKLDTSPQHVLALRENDVVSQVGAIENLLHTQYNADLQTVIKTSKEGIKESVISSNNTDELIIFSNIDNEGAIVAKAHRGQIKGLSVTENTLRDYPDGGLFAHVTGYVGPVFSESEAPKYAAVNDIVGKVGLERQYDEILFGQKGKVLLEYDNFGKAMPSKRVVIPEKSGQSVVTSIDMEIQNELAAALEYGIEKYDASGGVAIIEDVTTGEIVAMVSTPSYDPNEFVIGITQEQFEKYLSDTDGLPLINKAIAAQYPPGSTFKTLLASSALDAGVITQDTVYVSSSAFRLSNGASFQEYHNHSYGPLDLIGAIKHSSNQYFCQTILDWDIEEFDTYLEKFGIGQPTGIDLPGEASGRIPSPEVKIAYASDPNVTWLDPIWYPEGDSCNSAIGQGITTVTPIQMVNWISAIANGGTLHRPHIAIGVAKDGYWTDTQTNRVNFAKDGHLDVYDQRVDNEIDFAAADKIERFDYSPLRTHVTEDKALAIVREAMHRAVIDNDGGIFGLRGAKVDVAAKTGTAEFGALNKDGSYEHAHGWVTGFYPYDDPKYAFVMLLEDAGESYYTVDAFRQFIDGKYQSD